MSGALYVPDYATLLVADLHFEKGSSYLARGLHIPPYDTRSTLVILESAIGRYRPSKLIALGDSFHDADGPGRLDPRDRARIVEISQALDVVWIAGNHDPEVGSNLGGRQASEATLGPLVLRHIPASLGDAECETAGHFHPVASVITRGRRITAKSFLASDRRMVMPAFGSYTGGLDARSPEITSLFARGEFVVWMIGRTDIYRLASSVLG